MSCLRRRTLLVVLGVGVMLASRGGEAGSLYSSKGIGLWRLCPGAQGAAMGGVGIALLDNLAINLYNPAARYPAGFTRVSTSMAIDLTTTTTAHATATGHFAQASGFAMLVPLGKRISVSAVLRPVSEVRYAASSSDTLPGYQFVREVTGEGGLNQGEFSLFVMPFRSLYVGASANLYFGRIRERWRTNFSSTDFASSDDRFLTHLQGVGGTFGVVVRPTARWNVGAVVSPAVQLNVATDVTHAFRGADSAYQSQTRLPLMWGLGVTYQALAGLSVGGDYYRQQWAGVEPVWEGRYGYANGEFLMLGAEYLPSRKPLDPYFKKVAYRAGARYGRLPLVTGDGNQLKEYALTLGLGMPFFSFLGRLDVAYEWVLRGALPSHPARERTHRLLISLGGAERWFQRQ